MKTPKRESLKLQTNDWRALEKLAAETGSVYSGQPSWRRLIMRIARGEVKLRQQDCVLVATVQSRRQAKTKELKRRLKSGNIEQVRFLEGYVQALNDLVF